MKSIWKSKTVWTNAAVAAGIAVAQSLGQHLSPEIVAAGMAVLNLFLRRAASQPVRLV